MATQVSETGSKTRARGATDELAIIAQRAQAFTNASGTAIALMEGSADEIICRARSGASSPEVGTALRVEGSFTGLCIQSGKELRCDDAETDTRVDLGAIRALGIRSMVVTPIKDDSKVVGVLAVFAPIAHAFTITHVAVLKTMADQIAVLLQKERKARDEGVQPETPKPPVSVTAPKPVAAAPAPLPPPVVIKPVAARASFPMVSKVEPIKAAPVAEEVSIPTLRREERSEAKHDLPSISSVSSASESKKSPTTAIIGGVVVLAIAGGSFFAYRKMHNPAPPQAQHVQETPSNVGIPPSTTTSGPAVGTSGQPSTSAAPANAAPANAAASKPAPDTRSADTRSERAAAKNNPPAPPPPEKRTPEAVSLSGGTSRLGAENVQVADAAPVISVGSGNSGALTSLTKPVASSTPSMISQSELEPVQVLKKVQPVYPTIAKVRRLAGTATVQFTVGKDGKVSNLQYISGLPVFQDAAFEAVKQWQFKAARLNGQPIEQTMQAQMKFGPGQ